jgi:hypothetical protein
MVARTLSASEILDAKLIPSRWSYAGKALIGVIIALALMALFGAALFTDLKRGWAASPSPFGAPAASAGQRR